MKRFALILIGLLALAVSVNAAEWKSPLAFDRYEWNFGSINPAEGTVCAKCM